MVRSEQKARKVKYFEFFVLAQSVIMRKQILFLEIEFHWPENLVL